MIDYIQHAAAHGLYEIRGLGAKRKLPHFDDLLSSPRRCRAIRWKAIARTARRRPCSARGSRSKPIELAIPITIAGMSFGALSANVKEALGRAATEWAPRRPPATAA